MQRDERADDWLAECECSASSIPFDCYSQLGKGQVKRSRADRINWWPLIGVLTVCCAAPALLWLYITWSATP